MSIPDCSWINWLQDIPVFCQLSIFEPINVTYLCCFVLAFKCTFEENKYRIPVFRSLKHMHMRLYRKEMLRKFFEAIPAILHFRAMLFTVIFKVHLKPGFTFPRNDGYCLSQTYFQFLLLYSSPLCLYYGN